VCASRTIPGIIGNAGWERARGLNLALLDYPNAVDKPGGWTPVGMGMELANREVVCADQHLADDESDDFAGAA